MHREGVNGRWKSGLKRAGIEVERKRMMHALRHTAVSVWLSRGISTKAVAEFIGDTEHTVISTYSHLMPDDRDKARRAMEDFMSGPAEDPSQAAPEGSELKMVP
jgi:integrase